ncbi:MAG: hypothetical protein K5838_07395 [Elusimicrobiales bacterium]|nr:hypothetical protein [Elusimicrobiales bacterium]
MKIFFLILTLMFTFGAAAFFANKASKAGLMQSGCDGCIFENSPKAEDHLSYENCPYPDEFAKARAAEEAAKLESEDKLLEDDLSQPEDENTFKNNKQNTNSNQEITKETVADLEPDYGMD